MPEDGKISVFLLDDHEVVRRGVHELLDVEDDIEVVGEAGTAAEPWPASGAAPRRGRARRAAAGRHGVEVCREIRSRDEDIRA